MSALSGKRVVVTRAPHQAVELETRLRQQNAVPLLYPCIEIVPAADLTPLQDALIAASSGAFNWLILTSANTVFALEQVLQSLKLDMSILRHLHVAAVGSSTAKAAEERLKLHIELIPENFTSEALVASFHFASNQRILLPQSALAETILSDVLTEMGAVVTAIEAYQTVVGSGGVDLPRLLAAGEVDVITLTSASTVGNLIHRLKSEGGDLGLLDQVCIACIGTKTASAARNRHLPATTVPTEHTLAGLVAALERYYADLLIGESD